MNTRAILRILPGALVLAVGAWNLGTAISHIVHPPIIYELNGPGRDGALPLGLSTYGMPCITALLVIAAGWALIKHWWGMLFLICWYFLCRLVIERLNTTFFSGWGEALDVELLLPALPLAAISIACLAAIRSSERSLRDDAPPASAGARWPPGWPVEAALSLAVIAIIVWRVVVLATGVDGDAFLMFLRHLKGGEWAYRADLDSITECTIGPIAAAAAAAGSVLALRGRQLLLRSALVAIAAMTIDGLLHAIDLALRLDVPSDFSASVPYEVAMFVASIAALAATFLARRLDGGRWHIIVGAIVAVLGALAMFSTISRIVRRIGHARSENYFALDGPPPLGFSSYAMACVFALIIVAAGWAIARRRWLELSLFCWFILTLILLEFLCNAFLAGWRGLLPTSLDLIVSVPLLVTSLACWMAISRSKACTLVPRISPVETVLASLVVAGLLVRSTASVLGTESDMMLEHLRGNGMEVGGDVAGTAACIIGPVVALGLAGSILAARRGRDTAFITILTVISATTITSAFTVLDVALGLENHGFPEPTTGYAAFVFAASLTALALALYRRRPKGPEASG